MATNGRDLLLTVRTSTGPDVYTVLGSQQGAELTRAADAIDTSSKDSMDATAMAGRRSWELTCDALLVPNDAAYLALRIAYNTGVTCRARTTAVGGRAAETGDCVVTEMGESFPDNEAMTVAISLQGTGPLS